MITAQFLKARVSPETKQRVQWKAQEQLITESIWVRRVVDAALRDEGPIDRRILQRTDNSGREARLYVRLRTDDRLLLRERALARGMAPATYVSVLVRAHLHGVAPLPKEELLALKRTVSELGAIGRNINQIVRATNQGARSAGLSREDLTGMLRVCEGLRDHVKGLIKTNTASWESGDAEANA